MLVSGEMRLNCEFLCAMGIGCDLPRRELGELIDNFNQNQLSFILTRIECEFFRQELHMNCLDKRAIWPSVTVNRLVRGQF